MSENIVAKVLLQLDASGFAGQVQRQIGGIKANLNVGVDQRGAADVANLSRSMSAARTALDSTNAAATKTATGIRLVGQASVDASRLMDSLSASIGNASRRLVAFGIAGL